jgi:hypothetical protein
MTDLQYTPIEEIEKVCALLPYSSSSCQPPATDVGRHRHNAQQLHWQLLGFHLDLHAKLGHPFTHRSTMSSKPALQVESPSQLHTGSTSLRS